MDYDERLSSTTQSIAHVRATGHTVYSGIDSPWRCLSCSARSPLYELQRASIGVTSGPSTDHAQDDVTEHSPTCTLDPDHGGPCGIEMSLSDWQRLERPVWQCAVCGTVNDNDHCPVCSGL